MKVDHLILMGIWLILTGMFLVYWAWANPIILPGLRIPRDIIAKLDYIGTDGPDGKRHEWRREP